MIGSDEEKRTSEKREKERGRKTKKKGVVTLKVTADRDALLSAKNLIGEVFEIIEESQVRKNDRDYRSHLFLTVLTEYEEGSTIPGYGGYREV